MIRTTMGLVLLLVCGLLVLNACHQDVLEPAPRPRPDSPLDEVWFRTLLQFMDRIHDALQDPYARVELRLHLVAGQDEWAIKRLGIQPEEAHAMLARMELMRPDFESRWPELVEGAGSGGLPDPREYLLDTLRSPEWPVGPPDSAKPSHVACAVDELINNLAQCASWPPISQTFCYYGAYLRYLQHMAVGC